MMKSCRMLCYSDSTIAVLSLVSAETLDTAIDSNDSDVVFKHLASI